VAFQLCGRGWPESSAKTRDECNTTEPTVGLRGLVQIATNKEDAFLCQPSVHVIVSNTHWAAARYVVILLAHMQPRFGMIEVELDAAQNFVIDDILIAQLDDRPAFHVESVLLQTLVGGRGQPIRAISGDARANFQLANPVVVFSTEPLHELLRVAIDFRKVSQRCFIGFQPRRSFFHICEPIIYDSKPADQRGQTQTLEHERRKNHTKM